MTNIEELMRPFDGAQVKQRMGPGRKSLDYVSGPDVIRRLLDATGNQFSWSVEKAQVVTLETASGAVGLWIVQGTLTVGDLGSRSGVGTHPAESAESAKAAETDALKRAAIKFGVGLHLYEEDNGNSSGGGGNAPGNGSAPVPPRSGNGNGSYARPAPAPARGSNGYGAAAGNGNGNGGYRRNNPPQYAGDVDPNGTGSDAPF